MFIMTNNDSFGSRLKHAWNAFFNKDPTVIYRDNYGPGYGNRPDRPQLTRGNERSIVTAIYNRIAVLSSMVDIKHIRMDKDGRYIETIESDMNECLTTSANIDQTGRAFIQDVVISMLDEGHVAVVPVDTSLNPEKTGSYDIQSMRTGKILEWHPQVVRVRVYNEKSGEKEDIFVPKKFCAIIENPFYAVMNESSSTLQRLIRKLNLLDVIDEQSGSGKLNMIIQLPYVIKTDARKQQAENRRKDLEDQLANSKYGIAYTDGTEKVTQINRAVENNLMGQIEYLTSMLYSQLGINQAILDGTADEKTMLNFMNNTIEPILVAITEEMNRKFLTKTARTQGQKITFFDDPFRLIPVNQVAEIADKFTRNEIMTSNEVRQKIGMKPSDNPRADELRNANISESKQQFAQEQQDIELEEELKNQQNLQNEE